MYVYSETRSVSVGTLSRFGLILMKAVVATVLFQCRVSSPDNTPAFPVMRDRWLKGPGLPLALEWTKPTIWRHSGNPQTPRITGKVWKPDSVGVCVFLKVDRKEVFYSRVPQSSTKHYYWGWEMVSKETEWKCLRSWTGFKCLKCLRNIKSI